MISSQMLKDTLENAINKLFNGENENEYTNKLRYENAKLA